MDLSLNVITDPVVIGATGGSGTRVVETILECLGFFMGAHINQNKDAVPVRDFFRKWEASWITYWKSNGGQIIKSFISSSMRDEFFLALEEHLGSVKNNNRLWGLKSPRSMVFLPFLHYFFPGLKFVHVIRNGLDMVYSSNWRLDESKEIILDELVTKDEAPHVKKMMYWSKMNKLVSEYGKNFLKENYIWIRFEDLCKNPKAVIKKLCRFLKVQSTAQLERFLPNICLPSSTGRWRNRGIREIYEIMSAGRDALKRFGYWNQEIWEEINTVMNSSSIRKWIYENFRMRRLPAF